MRNIMDLAVNTIRFLSAEAVQKANSGHPGLPLGAAPIAFTLWSKFLKANPANPNWLDRDRFILSAGHGSAMLYSLLHLFGYGLTIEDLKNFRKADSLTPGHPEYGHTVGVEVTTGPLGQGIANGVGMAMAEKHLAAQFNKPNMQLVDHYTYVLCGDGCLMEGVAAEAVSLAGTLKLGKLILLYDSNNITIEGDTDITFRENVGDRFRAYDWDVQLVPDGNNTDDVAQAIEKAKAVKDKPSLIEIKTIIGFGAPNKQGKASVHGEPLGYEEIKAAKKALGWPHEEEEFHIPEEVKTHINTVLEEKATAEAEWNSLVAKYESTYPDDYKQWKLINSDKLSVNLLDNDDFWTYEGSPATRASSEQVLNKACLLIPNLIGGSADLAPSTKTVMKGRGSFSAENPAGSNLHFGVREHAMTAIANGIALHGGLIPYVAGFFVFSDYMKPAMRMSALMELPVIYIMTHDSIGVGEDGPTHQPVEQLAALRSIPGFTVVRPCDTRETAAAWYLALTRKGPTALALSRQGLPALPGTGKASLRGAYIIKESGATPDVILLASGSEVSLICEAVDALKEKGVNAQAVSMFSMEVFEEQEEAFKESVLPNTVRARLAVEAGSSFGWHKYVGLDGDVISVDTFGASGDAKLLFKQFGFTVENIVSRALALLDNKYTKGE